jgi:glycosyltransferase involved in cell wall biosynthesis
VNKIVEAFIRLELPDACLVLKATCMQEVKMNIPNVFIINGLMPQEYLDSLHEQCHCYVSFSHSEGVGMGAVEAAMCDKPVIITEYSAPKEYIKTPYTIKCGTCEIPQDDFLFQKGMVWGKPSFKHLMEYMKDAYTKKLTYMDHSHTRHITSLAEIYKTWASI